MLKQGLQQRMQQKLLPMQIQIMKLLEIPSAQIEQRIKEELEANPVLEIEEEDPADATIEEYVEEVENQQSYKFKTHNYAPDDERPEIPLSEGMSFYEHLIEQLGLLHFDERENNIGKYIIGNIDDDGYLRRETQEIADDISFSTNVEVEKDEVERLLQIIQSFDPIGVGARDLQECLLLQLRANKQSKINDLAIIVIERCFEEFTKKHYDKILKKLHIDDKDELREAIEEILRLNPKPGSVYGGTLEKNSQAIVPDFILEFENNKITFRLNRRSEPDLKISNAYAGLLREYVHNRANQNKEQREAVTFVKQKIQSARWFIEAMKQRRNTLTLVMQAIIDMQQDFFIDGDDSKLKPMALKDVAAKTGLDTSTISRVSNSKYVQTPFGIFSLRYFFSEGIQSTEGEDVSTREVKRFIADAIENEDKSKPLTDEKLCQMLEAKSYKLTRRTVAKYRESMGLTVARLRKKL